MKKLELVLVLLLLLLVRVSEQTAPAPSDAAQFSEPQALAEQLESEDSEPVHATSSSQNEFCTLRLMGADVAEPRPSCLQTTVASFMPQ